MVIRVLVVEDEDKFREVILKYFNEQILNGSYEFIFAENGVKALKLIEAYRHEGGVDLLITDIKMAKLDGLELLKKLNQKKLYIKTIVISAYTDSSNFRTAIQEKALDFLPKPFLLKDLEASMQQVLLQPKLVDEDEIKARPITLLSLASKLEPELKIKHIIKLLSKMNLEDLKEIQDTVEAQISLVQQATEEERLLELSNSTKNLHYGVTIEELRNCYVEEKYITRKVATGEEKSYGPFYYIKGKDKSGKPYNKYVGKEDPRTIINSLKSNNNLD